MTHEVRFIKEVYSYTSYMVNGDNNDSTTVAGAEYIVVAVVRGVVWRELEPILDLKIQ